MEPSDVLGEFTDLAGLLAALRQIRERLGISLETLDQLGGLPDRHSSKILGPRPARHLGVLSLNKMLNGLGVKCVLVRDPVTAPAVEAAPKRNASQVRRRAVADAAAPSQQAAA